MTSDINNFLYFSKKSKLTNSQFIKVCEKSKHIFNPVSLFNFINDSFDLKRL